jgi:hypothetical protein
VSAEPQTRVPPNRVTHRFELGPRGSAPKVGFAACAVDGGRVMRVGLVGEGKPPRKPMIDCPNCGKPHDVVLSWRSATRFDEGREAEIVVEAIERV